MRTSEEYNARNLEALRDDFMNPPSDNKPVTHCEECGAEMFIYSDAYQICDKFYCRDCCKVVSLYDKFGD